MIKILATLIITAGFAFGIYCLRGGCWPCFSFIAWVLINAFIWCEDRDIRVKIKGDETEDEETDE